MLGRFPPRKQNIHRGLGEEAGEKDFVPVLLRAAIKSRLDLRHDDQRDPDFIAFAQTVSQLRIALKQIGEPVGVEGNSYFHLSQSIWRWDAITSSNAGSGVQRPTKSEKSVLRGRPMVARVSSWTTT